MPFFCHDEKSLFHANAASFLMLAIKAAETEAGLFSTCIERHLVHVEQSLDCSTALTLRVDLRFGEVKEYITHRLANERAVGLEDDVEVFRHAHVNGLVGQVRLY